MFPPGTYQVSGTLTVASTGVTLRGSGRTATVIRATAAFASGDVIKYNAVAVGAVESLTIVSAAVRTGGAGIHLLNSREINILDVNMSNMFVGTWLEGSCVQIYLKRGYYTNNSSSGIGLWVDCPNGNDHFISDLIIWHDSLVRANRPNSGIRISGSQATWLDSVDALQCKEGLTIDPPAGGIITWLFISNSAFDTCSDAAIAIKPATGAVCNGISFTQSWAATSAAGPGVVISGPAVGVQMVNMRILNNSGHGITVSDTTRDVLLDACVIAGNGRVTAGSSGAIFAANSTAFAVRNCTIGARLAFAATQAVGLTVGTGSSGYIVGLNDLRGNTTSSFVDGGTGYAVTADNFL